MYKVAGSNIFGQWFSEECIINGFRAVSMDTSIINSRSAKLVFISWSYNIFLIDDELYLSGSYNGMEKYMGKIKLPVESANTEMIVCGNDNNLLLVGKNSNDLWVMKLEKGNEFKKLSFKIETPLGNDTKRLRKNDDIVQVAMMNETCLYLTSSGMVYTGLLPSYVDTSHCIGQVCDVQCGYEHNLLLTNAGRVYTWGNGRRLQLGHGEINILDVPMELEALAGIKIIKIRAGGWHSLALSEFGDLYSWGWNDTGQLGIKELDKTKDNCQSYSIPTLVDFFDDNGQVDKNIKDISCGSRHSAALLEDNSVWTTGCNKYGQLGLPREYSSVNFFIKSFQCDSDVKLMCGYWATVIKYNL